MKIFQIESAFTALIYVFEFQYAYFCSGCKRKYLHKAIWIGVKMDCRLIGIDIAFGYSYYYCY